MKKVFTKTLKSGIAFLLAVLLLLLNCPALTPYAQGTESGPGPGGDGNFDELMNELRGGFFDGKDELDLETVYIDGGRFIHKPQEYKQPAYGGGAGLISPSAITIFTEGSTRNFWAAIHSNGSYANVPATLIKQGAHVNIWVLNKAAYDAAMGGASHPAADQCVLNQLNKTNLTFIANTFDDIYARMTDVFGSFRKINLGYSTTPSIGDINEDGRVNLLLYNIGGKTVPGYGYMSGFFNSGDFFTGSSDNGMAMMHLDMAKDYGYSDFNSVEEGKRLAYNSVVAHEFQHMLFYMYFGVYMTPGTSDLYKWLNESLSELAGTFYTQPGTEIVPVSRTVYGVENEYDDLGYGDFLNFNDSFKNYGMSAFHSTLMHKKTGGLYAKDIYNYFRQFAPPANGYTDVVNNTDKISGKTMAEVIGGAFNRAGLTGSADGEVAFKALYFLFMENFAADGGNIITGGNSVPTVKFHANSYSAYNLWGTRLAIGKPFTPPLYLGAVYINDSNLTNGYYDPNAITTIASGNTVSMTGYNGVTPASGASHDKMYLIGNNASNPVLKISVDDSDVRTQYYVVVPKEAQETSLYPKRGQYGADVYPLLKSNADNYINTNGRPAYLFAATLYKNVSAKITYSWTTSAPGYAISGVVKSYNPKTATTIRLLQSGVEKYKTTVSSAAGTGQSAQNFTLTNVIPGTYALEITKPGHLKYTKTTVVVTNANVNLNEITLATGDLDGDGYVGYNDFLIFLANYNKSGASIVNPVADIDGDGYVGYNDFIAFLSGYGKANVVG